jgi:hypothetical protein
LEILQKRIASAAVTPSAARNMGPKGTIKAARKFLAEEISLKDAGSSGRHYPEVLDALTLRLTRSLPKNAQHWGAARKFLNIFLRDATYNSYLRNAYRLDRIEGHLEVPLDRQMATFLLEITKKSTGKASLPRWESVISVNPSINKKYQDATKLVAKSERLDPVHLDVIAWRKNTDYY